tara:strand:- start:696 stop:1058 length:363 start_codon:yes stop_codon:yes gene_type:complete
MLVVAAVEVGNKLDLLVVWIMVLMVIPLVVAAVAAVKMVLGPLFRQVVLEVLMVIQKLIIHWDQHMMVVLDMVVQVVDQETVVAVVEDQDKKVVVHNMVVPMLVDQRKILDQDRLVEMEV